MSKSRWKGPHSSFMLLKTINRQLKKEILTKSRNSAILPQFVGKTLQVHNGKSYTKVSITETMVGHKLGEFSPTRKRFSFKQKKQK